MKQTFIIRNNGKHLLLFFAGWGMDETPFRHIHPAECDWMICYDYRSLEFDTTLIQAYSKITLIAWSMGVLGGFAGNEAISLPACFPKYRHQRNTLSDTRNGRNHAIRF